MGTPGPPDTHEEGDLRCNGSRDSSTTHHPPDDSSGNLTRCDGPPDQTGEDPSPLSTTRPPFPSPSPLPGIPRPPDDETGVSYEDDNVVPARLHALDWPDNASENWPDDKPGWGTDKASLDEEEWEHEAREYPDPVDPGDSGCSWMSSSSDPMIDSPVRESRSPESKA